MKALTVKEFCKDFIFHFLVFNGLYMLYDIMKSYPGPIRFDVVDGILDLGWRLIPVYCLYITYCVLFYHLFFKKVLLHEKPKRLIIIFISLMMCFFIGEFLLVNSLIASRRVPQTIIWFDPVYLFTFIIFTVYSIAYSSIRGFSWIRVQKLRVEKENAVASLQNLRSQIEPHFIFNSLNSVYALSMDEKAQKTAESIEELSGLFRYSLKDSGKATVPVEEELGFIEKYIHLHKIRIQENDRTKISTSIFWDKKPASIVPMLAIPFIENAFKYGISFRNNSFIDIRISVENSKFQLQVRNSHYEDEINVTNGCGLKNTRIRLELLYPGKYFLEEKRDKPVYEVVLNINLV